jgi:hypothetical protein
MMTHTTPDVDAMEKRLLAIVDDACISAQCRAVGSSEHAECHAERKEAEKLIADLANLARRR